jgi:hypothetical protein
MNPANLPLDGTHWPIYDPLWIITPARRGASDGLCYRMLLAAAFLLFVIAGLA